MKKLMGYVVAGVLIIALLGSFSIAYREETNVPENPDGGVDMQYHQLHANGSGFFLNGTVGITHPLGEKVELRHVMLCLYDEGGSVIDSRDLGTFEPPSDRTGVNLSTTQTLTYVVVYHPALHERSITFGMKRSKHGFRQILAG